MSHDAIRARLNLYAVLPNLEDVVRDDPQMRALVSDARVTVRFRRGGPRADVSFRRGVCTVGRGSGPEAGTAVGAGGARPERRPVGRPPFASASHLNRMFDGSGQPIPLWGFKRLGFLKRSSPSSPTAWRTTSRPPTNCSPTPAIWR